jgi:hypothetical protein
VVVALCLVGLIDPGAAWAHSRAPTVAIDYRFTLAPLPKGVQGRILDGDRALRVSVASGVRLVVLGYLHEPELRFGPAGVWVNAGSPTAAADRLVNPGKSGWTRVSSSPSFAWHEHRLTPAGAAGRFVIPVLENGRPAAIAGTFVRVPRPRLWLWLGGGVALFAAVALAASDRRLRVPLALGLGVVSGIAAFAAAVGFALRDQTRGGVGWVAIGAAIAVAVALGVPLVRLSDRRRARTAGIAGAVAAAVAITWLPVFWHGVVISAFPADAARLACALALVGGAAAAAISLFREFDE